MSIKTGRRRHPGTERSVIYLTLAGKRLDPDRITHALGMCPDARAKPGDLYGGVKQLKFDHGFWELECSKPRNARIKTKMKRILERIAPVRRQLRKLIRDDNTLTSASLTIDFDVPRGVVVCSRRFTSELIGGFTSLGLDIDLEIWVPGLAVRK
jgi:hypothetical protein